MKSHKQRGYQHLRLLQESDIFITKSSYILEGRKGACQLMQQIICRRYFITDSIGHDKCTEGGKSLFFQNKTSFSKHFDNVIRQGT